MLSLMRVKTIKHISQKHIKPSKLSKVENRHGFCLHLCVYFGGI